MRVDRLRRVAMDMTCAPVVPRSRRASERSFSRRFLELPIAHDRVLTAVPPPGDRRGAPPPSVRRAVDCAAMRAVIIASVAAGRCSTRDATRRTSRSPHPVASSGIRWPSKYPYVTARSLGREGAATAFFDPAAWSNLRSPKRRARGFRPAHCAFVRPRWREKRGRRARPSVNVTRGSGSMDRWRKRGDRGRRSAVAICLGHAAPSKPGHTVVRTVCSAAGQGD